jgi:esterase/lipase
MKNALLTILCLLILQATGQAPKKEAEQRFVFFLHNKFIEDFGTEGKHPEYGKAEYAQIVSTFKNEGFNVISEIRPKNTDVKFYANKVIRQIDSLLRLKIKANNITVIGISKGGFIAMQVSSTLKNPAINFVFIGCCGNAETTGTQTGGFCGNILSIYEKTDSLGQSCQAQKNKSPCEIKHFKEIELNTGLKHGFLYKPLKEWINPSVKWAKNQY